MVMKIKKHAQMKVQQTAFMLIAVTLLFVMVGMFIIVVKFSGLHESATELEKENARLLVTKLANSPEFSCGESFGTLKTNCIDADKIMMLKEDIVKYVNFWGVSNIEVRKIYPKTEGEVLCSTGNYSDCNIIRLFPKEVAGFDVDNFVSLCGKESSESGVYNKCELAKIMISYEEQ
ncbi:MAG: hypothetical protein ABIA78_03785 [archaeon]